jgi:hypothetical protein
LPIDTGDLEEHYTRQLQDLQDKFLFQQKLAADLQEENNHVRLLKQSEADRLEYLFETNEDLERAKELLIQNKKELEVKIDQLGINNNTLQMSLKLEKETNEKLRMDFSTEIFKLRKENDNLLKRINEHGKCYSELEVKNFEDKYQQMAICYEDLKTRNDYLQSSLSDQERDHRYYQDRIMILESELDTRNNKSLSEEVKGNLFSSSNI